MEKKHGLYIEEQIKEEKWLMSHIKPGCKVDYGVGRVLFAGEIAGFLNPMGEGISAGMESGHSAACAIMEHDGNLNTICTDYQQRTKGMKNYMERQWSFVGGMSDTFSEMK